MPGFTDSFLDHGSGISISESKKRLPLAQAIYDVLERGRAIRGIRVALDQSYTEENIKYVLDFMVAKGNLQTENGSFGLLYSRSDERPTK